MKTLLAIPFALVWIGGTLWAYYGGSVLLSGSIAAVALAGCLWSLSVDRYAGAIVTDIPIDEDQLPTAAEMLTDPPKFPQLRRSE